ncbi:MAG: hypothetical protein RMJ33_14655 [Saprospiraceae bacterium]|nr:hypothetical protein [Saprospiraceae bacterium]MDW8231070.1 hypothetical protein [Saprospiraceae bacterium]
MDDFDENAPNVCGRPFFCEHIHIPKIEYITRLDGERVYRFIQDASKHMQGEALFFIGKAGMAAASDRHFLFEEMPSECGPVGHGAYSFDFTDARNVENSKNCWLIKDDTGRRVGFLSRDTILLFRHAYAHFGSEYAQKVGALYEGFVSLRGAELYKSLGSAGDCTVRFR